MKRLLLYLLLVLGAISVKADSYPINYSIEIKHYVFDIGLSDNTNEIKGKATITIRVTKEGLKNLTLDLIQRTEGGKGMGMMVDSVNISGIPFHFSLNENQILLNLDQSPKSGTELTVKISYHGIPASGLLIGKTQFGKRSFFSDNWPNKARNWLPTFDHPYYKASSEFIVKAPVHYQVISNGLLMEETNLDSLTKLTHWKQSLPVSCWLYDLGVADFAVQYYDTFQGKSLQTWVFPENREAGFYDFSEVTKPSVQFFSDYIGPYVYEKIANIQTASVAGGMESSSAIFYAQDLITGKRSERLRNVVIHELAHQWFGNSVTEKSWDEVWLSEGFATFFTLLFIENEYGKDEYRKGLIQSRNTIYRAAKQLPGFKIIDDRSPEKEEVTSAITYQKGAWTLHMLRNLIGDENFKKGIREYYHTYMNGHATTKDFQDIMEKVSGTKLGSFFDQWLKHSENPELNGNWKFDPTKKLIRIHLEQTQPGNFVFDLPIEIGITEKGKKEQRILKLHLSSKSLDQEFSLTNIPEKVYFDPRVILLAQIKGNFDQ